MNWDNCIGNIFKYKVVFKFCNLSRDGFSRRLFKNIVKVKRKGFLDVCDLTLVYEVVYYLYCFACMSIGRRGGDRLVQLKGYRHAAVLVL